MSTTTFDPKLACPHCGQVVGDEPVVDVILVGFGLHVHVESGHQICSGPRGVVVYCPDPVDAEPAEQTGTGRGLWK